MGEQHKRNATERGFTSARRRPGAVVLQRLKLSTGFTHHPSNGVASIYKHSDWYFHCGGLNLYPARVTDAKAG